MSFLRALPITMVIRLCHENQWLLKWVCHLSWRSVLYNLTSTKSMGKQVSLATLVLGWEKTRKAAVLQRQFRTQMHIAIGPGILPGAGETLTINDSSARCHSKPYMTYIYIYSIYISYIIYIIYNIYLYIYVIFNHLHMSILGPRKVILNKTWWCANPLPSSHKGDSKQRGGEPASWILNHIYSTQDSKTHPQSSGCCWQFRDCKIL